MTKSAKNEPAAPEREGAKAGQVANEGVEPMVIALAEQLGTFLGRVQAKADGWLENQLAGNPRASLRTGRSRRRITAELLKKQTPAKFRSRDRRLTAR